MPGPLLLNCLQLLVFSDEEKAYFANAAARLKASWLQEREDQTSALTLRLTKISGRLEHLTDAYLDQAFDRDLFEKRKEALLTERKGIEESLTQLRSAEIAGPSRA